jgi:hypothetical protein
MFYMRGEVSNCYDVPASEKYPDPSYKVQILGDQVTKDGQIKKELVTLGIPFDAFKVLREKVGQSVTLPIGLFVANGRMQPFFPKAHTKDIVSGSAA